MPSEAMSIGEACRKILCLLNSNLYDAALLHCSQLDSRYRLLNAFLQAKCLFHKGFPYAAIQLLQEGHSSIDQTAIFVAQVYIDIGKYEEAIKVLKAEQSSLVDEESQLFNSLFPLIYNPTSLRSYLSAYCHHKLGNVEKCIQLARLAYQQDPTNLELIKFVEEYSVFPLVKHAESINQLVISTDSFITSYRNALQLSRQGKYKESLAITNSNCQIYLQLFLPLHLANLYHQRDRLAIYRLGQWMFKHHAKSHYSYLVVGTYFLLDADSNSERIEAARKYFCKATLLNRSCRWSWEGFAVTFSVSFDYDQAVAAFSTLSKLVPSNPYPYLRIGIEYSRSDNNSIALKYFEQALRILLENEATLDATTQQSLLLDYALYDSQQLSQLLYNEIGMIHFKNQNYKQAMLNFNFIREERPTFLVNKAFCMLYAHPTANLEAPVRLLQRAVELNPGPEFRFALSAGLFLAGRTDLAIDELFCRTEEPTLQVKSGRKSTQVDETREFFDFLITQSLAQ